MKNYVRLPFYVILVLLVASCNQTTNKKNITETMLKGSTTVLVDETLQPIIEDQIEIFESRYEAKIKMEAKSEKEAVKALVDGSSNVAILSRKLTDEEIKFFNNKKVSLKVTPFAIDAITFIVNGKSKDSLIALKDVLDFMTGKTESKIKGLVFDNPNSSTVRYMIELAGLKAIPQKGVFSFGTNNEVIKFVADNEGMIGVVGLNWMSQPKPEMKNFVDQVKIVSVKGLKSSDYIYPDQNNLGEGTYPLARNLFIINCQGYSGLGMGFASFLAGDVGQRIILKSGLLPFKTPPRKLIVRKKISIEEK